MKQRMDVDGSGVNVVMTTDTTMGYRTNFSQGAAAVSLVSMVWSSVVFSSRLHCHNFPVPP